MSLPDLLVIGVPKAGTSSLFAYLAQHPDVCASTKKETGYFTSRTEDGRSGPLADYERYFSHRQGERYAVEATPAYCYGGPRVMRAIRDTLEHPRLLLIVREPADRLWSAYTFQRSLGHLGRIDSFEAYVAACERERERHPAITEQGHLKGLSIGMYGAYVPAWAEAFREDLRVLFFDDLRRDPAGVVAGVCTWLGIDPEVAGRLDYGARNPTVHPRSVSLARGADVARGLSRRVLRRAPGLRRRLRDGYFRLNAGAIDERPSAETLARLTALYADSNRATASALADAGIDTMPAWLAATGPVAP